MNDSKKLFLKKKTILDTGHSATSLDHFIRISYSQWSSLVLAEKRVLIIFLNYNEFYDIHHKHKVTQDWFGTIFADAVHIFYYTKYQ